MSYIFSYLNLLNVENNIRLQYYYTFVIYPAGSKQGRSTLVTVVVRGLMLPFVVNFNRCYQPLLNAVVLPSISSLTTTYGTVASH